MAENSEYQPPAPLTEEEVYRLNEHNRTLVMAWMLTTLYSTEQLQRMFGRMSWHPLSSSEVALECNLTLDGQMLGSLDFNSLTEAINWYLFKDLLHTQKPQLPKYVSNPEEAFEIIEQVFNQKLQQVYEGQYTPERMIEIIQETFLEQMAESSDQSGIPLARFVDVLVNGTRAGLNPFLRYQGRIPLTIYRQNQVGDQEALRINQDSRNLANVGQLYPHLEIHDLPLFLHRAAQVFTRLGLDQINQNAEKLLKDASNAELAQPLEMYLAMVLASLDDPRFKSGEKQVGIAALNTPDQSVEKPALVQLTEMRPKVYDEGTKQISVAVNGLPLQDVRFDVGGNRAVVRAVQAPEKEGEKLSVPQQDIEFFEEERQESIEKLLNNLDTLADVLLPWDVPMGTSIPILVFEDNEFGDFRDADHARHQQLVLVESDGRPLLDQLDDLIKKWAVEPPEVDHIVHDLVQKGSIHNEDTWRKRINFTLQGKARIDLPRMLVREEDLVHDEQAKVLFREQLKTMLESDDWQQSAAFLNRLTSSRLAITTPTEQPTRYQQAHHELFNADLWKAFEFVTSEYKLQKYKDDQEKVAEIKEENQAVSPITGRIVQQHVLEIMANPGNMLGLDEELADFELTSKIMRILENTLRKKKEKAEHEEKDEYESIRKGLEKEQKRMKQLKKAVASLMETLQISEMQAVDIYRRLQPVVSTSSFAQETKDGNSKHKSFASTPVMLSLAMAIARFRDEGITQIGFPDNLPFRRHYDVSREMPVNRTTKAFTLDTRIQHGFLASAIALAELIDNLEIVAYPDEGGFLEFSVTGPLSSPHPVINEILEKV